jgi:hypothetical protein
MGDINMSCPAQPTDTHWLAENIASAALYGGAHLIVAELYRVWHNYGDLFRSTPGLSVQLERVNLVLADLKDIFHDVTFNAVLNDRERKGVDIVLKEIERRSIIIEKQIEPFQTDLDEFSGYQSCSFADFRSYSES